MLIYALALTAAPAAVELPAEDEIVVIAQRLRKVRFSFHAKDGELMACKVTTASSPIIDTIVCKAARQCAAEQPNVGDRHLAPCIKDRVRTLFTEFRAGR